MSEPLAQNSTGTAPGRPFVKGQSGNPGGRPKGLMRLVREETQDGAEVVDFMLAVLRGKKKASLRLRMEAAAWLADRGFGKVPQPMEHSGPGGGPMEVQHGGLSDDERLARLVAVYDAVRARLGRAPADGDDSVLGAPGGAADGGLSE